MAGAWRSVIAGGLAALGLVLAGCAASPSPGLAGAARVEVALAGRAFTVWHDGRRAEVVRHGPARRGEHAHLLALMARAAEIASGCPLRPGTIEGDSGVLRAGLRCASRGARGRGKRGVVGVWGGGGGGAEARPPRSRPSQQPRLLHPRAPAGKSPPQEGPVGCKVMRVLGGTRGGARGRPALPPVAATPPQ